MTTLYFQTAEGETIELQAKDGASVMEAAVAANVPGIDAECGGACSCATCHGYIGEPWAAQLPERSATEVFMLEAVVDERPDSRLCCQIKVRPELEGLVVRLPAEQA